jgi:hypothetical protein
MEEIEDIMYCLDEQYGIPLGALTRAEVQNLANKCNELIKLMDKNNLSELPEQDV